jgi:hypothetical protein
MAGCGPRGDQEPDLIMMCARTGSGAVRPSSATTRPTWARASPSCAPATRGHDAGDVGAVRRLPGHLHAHRDRRERGGHPPGPGQHPHALAAATDTVAPFPLTRQTSPSSRSWPSSSCPASSPATAQTGPARGKPRRPATSPPARPTSPASPAGSSSTCSALADHLKARPLGLDLGRDPGMPRADPLRALDHSGLHHGCAVPVRAVRPSCTQAHQGARQRVRDRAAERESDSRTVRLHLVSARSCEPAITRLKPS